MSAAGPLRGATRPEGGGFAAAVFPGSPRRVRGRSSGLKGAAHRAGARQPCGLPWTPETSAAPGGRKSGQARACPAARGAQPPRWRAHASTRTPGNRLNWRSILGRSGKLHESAIRKSPHFQGIARALSSPARCRGGGLAGLQAERGEVRGIHQSVGSRSPAG